MDMRSELFLRFLSLKIDCGSLEMPRPKSPATLYSLCLCSVSHNIRAFFPISCEDSPFRCLPAALNEDLIRILQSATPVSINFDCICHILRTGVRRVNLSLIDRCKGVRSRLPRVLRAIRYGNLTHLSLGGATHRDDKELLNIVPFLRGLRCLSLFLPNVTDRVVAAISNYCNNLTELALYGERITDKGLHLLARCSKLRLLRLEGDRRFSPAISMPSTFRLLSELQSLQQATLPHLTEAIQHFQRDHKLSLTEYDDKDCVAPPTERRLVHICQVCPHLAQVKLTPRGSEDLSPLQRLRSLRELSLNVVESRSGAHFRLQVQPLMGVVGGNLRSLTLHLMDVDLGVLSKYCSRLEELEIANLSKVSWSGSAWPTFPKLRRLKLFLEADGPATSDDFYAVLSGSRELTELSLGWCELRDNTLKKLVESGSILKLRTLELSQVSEVTGTGLMYLVAVPSDLALLSIFGCERISRFDIFRLKMYIEECNYDLTVRCHM